MTRTKTLSFLTAAAAGALLAACAVGPKAPEAALPTSGTGGFVGAANPAVTAAAPARGGWTSAASSPASPLLPCLRSAEPTAARSIHLPPWCRRMGLPVG